MKFKLLFALLIFLSSLPLRAAEHVSIFSSNAIWRLFEGRTEASAPDITLWRTNDFDDSAFVSAFAPFFYGEAYPSGTLLAGPTEYTCIFLRKTFEIANPSNIAQLRLHAKFDDGFVVWVNGEEVLRVSVPGIPGSPGFPGDSVTYTTLASTTNEATTFFQFDLPNALSVLASNANVIAVQVFNFSTNSDDLVFDAALEAILVDTNLPIVIGVAPPPGPVDNLSQITVQFSELVFGVSADDLLINTNPAVSVTGSNDLYAFTFPSPPSGPVHISWSLFNGISDEAGLPFDGSAPGAQWDYVNRDTVAPRIVELNPAPGSIVYLLNEVRVAFSEGVRGVDATDLLLNGRAALNVITQSVSAYVFQFAASRPGNVQAEWASDHGITDLAPNPNAFTGTNWSYIANRAPYSILLNPNTNTILVAFSNRFDIGVCTVEGRDTARGARWVPLVNFYTTQRVGQVTLRLPTNYPNLRLVCVQIAPGNAQVRLPISYGNIHTIAGIPGQVSLTNAWRPEYEGAYGTNVVLSDPRYAVADSAGNIYVLERTGHAVSKITPDGRIHTFIGKHLAGFNPAVFGAGVHAGQVLLNTPSGLCLAGNFLYVLDAGNNRILATDLSSPITNTSSSQLFIDPTPNGIGPNASGLAIVMDSNGSAEEAFYGVGNQVRRLPLEESTDSPIITDTFYKVGNIVINPQGRTIVTDPVEGRIYRVRGNGTRELIAGRGFSNRRPLGGEVENVPLPGASSIWYLPIAFISNNLDPTYFISLDQGARVWYVDADNDNASPFIFGEPGAHAGDGEWFRKGGARPKVSNVLSVTMSPAGHIILVEGNGIVRKIDFVRSRP